MMPPVSSSAVALPPSRRSSNVARLVGLALAGALAAVGLGFALGATREEQWLLATRYTARFSFPVFLLAFTASSWARLVPGRRTRALVRARRGLGLGFATAHTVHLAALAIYNAIVANVPSLTTLAGGGVAYPAMYAMAATSNDWSVRRLGGTGSASTPSARTGSGGSSPSATARGSRAEWSSSCPSSRSLWPH